MNCLPAWGRPRVSAPSRITEFLAPAVSLRNTRAFRRSEFLGRSPRLSDRALVWCRYARLCPGPMVRHGNRSGRLDGTVMLARRPCVGVGCGFAVRTPVLMWHEIPNVRMLHCHSLVLRMYLARRSSRPLVPFASDRGRSIQAASLDRLPPPGSACRNPGTGN